WSCSVCGPWQRQWPADVIASSPPCVRSAVQPTWGEYPVSGCRSGFPASSRAMKKSDVIVVSAGHNGLVAALLLARKGLKVTVVEEKDMVGGAVKTERPFKKAPELATSTGAYLL